MVSTRSASKKGGAAAGAGTKRVQPAETISIQRTKKRTRASDNGEMATQVIQDQTSNFETSGPPGKKRKVAHFKDTISGEPRSKAPGAKKAGKKQAKAQKKIKHAKAAEPSSQLQENTAKAAKQVVNKKTTKANPQKSKIRTASSSTTKQAPRRGLSSQPGLHRLLSEKEQEHWRTAPPGESPTETDRQWREMAEAIRERYGARESSTAPKSVPPKASAAPKPTTANKPYPAMKSTQSMFYPEVRQFNIIRDDIVKEQLAEIRSLAEEFAEVFFNFQLPAQTTEQLILKLQYVMTPELQKIVGCIAVGGPGGAADWAELFADAELRMALVMGIIGTVLKEHVFTVSLFGAPKELLAELKDIEIEEKEDGWQRAERRAEVIDGWLEGTEYTFDFDSESVNLVLQLEQLLLPILSLDRTSVNNSGRWKDAGTGANFKSHLWRIVTTAAFLSIKMRRARSTIYHFLPSLKDDSFNRENMECHNRQTMTKKNPHQQEYDPANGFTDEWLNEHCRDVALTRICMFDSCVAYRRGAFDIVKGDRDRGFTSRRIIPALVACRWGQMRFSYKGEEVGKGYVEFADVVGTKPGIVTRLRMSLWG